MNRAFFIAPVRPLLRQASCHSSSLPVAAMVLGLLVPATAGALFHLLPWIAASTVFFSLMAMERSGGIMREWRAIAPMLVLLTCVAPMFAWVLGRLVGATAEEAAWMAMIAAAPASAVAVVNTKALGFPSRPTALLVLAGTLMAPFSLPLIALIFAGGTTLEPGAVAWRAVLVVIVPAGLAFLLRRWSSADEACGVTVADWKGIAALSLAALALARMQGIADQVVAAPSAAAWAAMLGVVACGTGAVLAARMPWPATWRGAVLAGGCKGGATVWALTAPYLPPAGHLFMALTILPIYGLPPPVALSTRAWPRVVGYRIRAWRAARLGAK